MLSLIIFLLYYKCHKINPKRSESYIESPDWIKTISPINDYDKYFQHTATVPLNHKEIAKKSKRIPKIKSLINKHN